MPTCFVVGAGEIFGALPTPASRDFLIAVDGGLETMRHNGLRPDLLVGDFDSLPRPPADLPLVHLPREKDDTDMVAALRIGHEKGLRRFAIYGGTGGRLDHTLANLQCLTWLAQRESRGFLYDRGSVATAIENGQIELPGGHFGIVSVFALSGEARGVYLRGLKYPLENATLRPEYPLGVSNELTGGPARIQVRQGVLTVLYPRDIREG